MLLFLLLFLLLFFFINFFYKGEDTGLSWFATSNFLVDSSKLNDFIVQWAVYSRCIMDIELLGMEHQEIYWMCCS